MNKLKQTIRWLVCAALLLGAVFIHAEETPATKTQLQSACLFHFTKFVTWPPSAFPTTNSDFIVGVLGNDSFGRKALPELDEIEGQTVNGHRIRVTRFSNYRDATQRQACQILFIATSEANHLNDVFNVLRAESILTVSELEDFAKDGGMVQFTTKVIGGETKVRFEINTDATRRANLKLSSQLLNLADRLWPRKS